MKSLGNRRSPDATMVTAAIQKRCYAGSLKAAPHAFTDTPSQLCGQHSWTALRMLYMNQPPAWPPAMAVINSFAPESGV